jgi:OOP family OmpA-OmpF porin
MRRTSTLALSALMSGAALICGAAYGGAAEGSWFIAPQINGVWVDDGRTADDDAGVTISFGRTLNEKWDAQLSWYGSEHQRAGDDSVSIEGIGFSMNRVFYREGRVNPFLSLGLAKQKSILKPGSDETNLTALYGAGLLITLGSERDDGSLMQLRADLGARHGTSNEDGVGVERPVEYVAGIGFQYSWGGTPKRLDSDGDGVHDDTDQCPGTPAGTPVDEKGCPLPQDEEGDGVTNDLDQCPGTPAGAKVNAQGCELDSDGDGVADSRDQCPATPAGAKVDANGCELDGDADGIVDRLDKCPDTPKGERVDNTGCPFKKELLLQGVKFETNSAELLPESLPVLDNARATLKRYPELNVEVAGHTDSRGSDAYNLALSGRRAEAVLQYLHAGGVTNAMTSKGYGERQPIASNNTEEGRLQNRRVVLRALN